MTRPSLAGIEQRAERSPMSTWTAVPALTAAVRDVLALHQEHEDTGKCNECTFAPYSQASVSWPCPTVRALAARLDLTDPEGEPT